MAGAFVGVGFGLAVVGVDECDGLALGVAVTLGSFVGAGGVVGWSLGCGASLCCPWVGAGLVPRSEGLGAAGVRAEQAGGMLLAVAAAAIVMVVGLVVESFCQLPPDDTAGADTA